MTAIPVNDKNHVNCQMSEWLLEIAKESVTGLEKLPDNMHLFKNASPLSSIENICKL
jgi:hypothetical protein